MPTSKDYDCVIIGGGPAGATVATLLADFGRSVLVLERATFPRHHIGESLMPQTYDTFKRLGVLDKLKASAYPRKESVQFVSASGSDSQPYYFTDRDPHERSITWQVRRDEFDKMMLDNAREHGAEVCEGVGVKEVMFEGEKAVGVRAVVDGAVKEIRAKVVVDATGMSAVLSRQLDIREPDEALRNASIYAYYKGTHRDEGRDGGATIIIHTPERKGWFWYIPLSDDVASIGVVAPPSYLCTGRGDQPLQTLEEEIANCPGIRRRMDGAERVSQAYVTSDFSYRSKRVAGDGWVLIGDAFAFLDPVYSSGVFLALKSGEFAADAIHDALSAGDVSAERLGCFGPKLAAGLHLIRRLVYVFYDREFSFGAFSRKHPEYRDHIVRLLIGDIFNDEVGEVFDVMREWTTLPAPVRLETG
ncbi:MAG: tryptophan 7-halogenase [Planctomycetes bacterium]|nr:tryptophan 7-halogenase [Planctomycetota bacterium]